MVIDINRFLVSLSKALDHAESELVGTSPFHSIRVAGITRRLMEAAGHPAPLCHAATAAAILHDCALAEYLKDEASLLDRADSVRFESDMRSHCTAGEVIGSRLPFYSLVPGAIRYHHERADGQGAFGMTAADTPIYSQYLHLADQVDVYASLYTFTPEKATALRQYLRSTRGIVFSRDCVDLFNTVITDDFLASLAGDISADRSFDGFGAPESDIPLDLLQDMSMIFADITDYKSHFTWRHSIGIAEKAFRMGLYYSCPQEECQKLYIAGLLHDIGKLLIPNSILEKPGRLDKEEYRTIQNHALGTWELLKDITGMEDIASWAALHHEKLDGSGYPFGYRSEQLSRNERLMACLDIYQALTETRPYKEGLSHTASMSILNKMGSDGQLDSELLRDIDHCFTPSAPADTDIGRPSATALEGTGPAYRCPVCGYIYEGELPEDFICPRCEQPGSIFEGIRR